MVWIMQSVATLRTQSMVDSERGRAGALALAALAYWRGNPAVARECLKGCP